MFDVGVTRLLRTCQTRFQCFQTPCAKLRLHHTSQDRYVQLPQLSWPSCCQATAAVGQLASPNTAIFQRTSNPEVKAKAATHKTMKSVIMIQLLVIRKPKVLDTEALTVERLSGGARQTQGSFPLSARLCWLLGLPAGGQASWQANDFMTFVQSCFVTLRPHGQATGQNTACCLTLKLGSGFPGY